MRLSKKQEKAIETALDILSVVLGSGLDRDEDGSIGEAIDELMRMRDKSLIMKAKAKEKAKKDNN